MKVTPDLGINFYCLFKINKISFFKFFLFEVLSSFCEYVTDTHANSARIGIDSRICLFKHLVSYYLCIIVGVVSG